MIVTIVGLIIIIFMSVLGYYRGVWRILGAFLCFLLATILTTPINFIFEWLLGLTSLVPKTLLHIIALLTGGMCMFVVLNWLLTRFINQRETDRVDNYLPAIKPWEKRSGAIAGGIWGIFLVILTLTGIHLIGNVEESILVPSMAELQHRYMQNSGEFTDIDPTSASYMEKIIKIKAAHLTTAKFNYIKNEIEASPFGIIVQKVDPFDTKRIQAFRDLNTVLNNPKMLEKFREHPIIAKLQDNPKILLIAKDREIQRNIQDRNYTALLNNEKIAELIKDKDLLKELKAVDLTEILEKIVCENQYHAY